MFIRVKKLENKALKVRRKRSDFDFDDDCQNLMIIIFEGVLGYVERDYYVKGEALMLRPGAVLFLL